jgi:beta-phosphoglucomutase
MQSADSQKTLSIGAHAALFDLDGVVVFTDKYHYLGWKKVSDENGYEFNEKLNDLCRGVPRMASLEVILGHNRVTLSQSEKEVLADRKNRYYVELLQSICADDLYPGVIDFLKKLRARGVKIGLCSSSRNAGLVLDRLELTAYFDAVVTGADIRHAKPHPEIFLLGASRLDTPPEKCVAFEDAPAGVDSALAAGMPCIGIGTPDLLPQATQVIQRYDQLDLNELFANSARLSR